MNRFVKSLFLIVALSATIFDSRSMSNMSNCAQVIASKWKDVPFGEVSKVLETCASPVPRVSLATKVFGWGSIVSSGVSFGRWIVSKCNNKYKFITNRNKFVRCLSGDLIGQGMNIAGMISSIISLSGALEGHEWLFWMCAGMEALPIANLLFCLISDIGYLFPHNIQQERQEVRDFLTREADDYNALANSF